MRSISWLPYDGSSETKCSTSSGSSPARRRSPISGSVPPGPFAGAPGPGASAAARAASTEAASGAACVVLREGTVANLRGLTPSLPPRAVARAVLGVRPLARASGDRGLRLFDPPRQQRLAGDDQALDLRGALVELHD